MARACRQLSSLVPHVERLELINRCSPFEMQGMGDVDCTQSIGLLQPFRTVRRLYVSMVLVSLVTHALHDFTAEGTAEVLPELRDLFLERLGIAGPVREAIRPFVAAQRLSGRPVAVHRWD